MSSIVSHHDIGSTKLTFSAPKVAGKGGKFVNIFKEGSREWFTFSTPLMFTWGPQEGTDQDDRPNDTWSTALQFPSSEYPDEEADILLENLKQFEATVKHAAMENSTEWFGKKITSMDVIDEKFHSMLYYPKIARGSAEIDPTKSPTLKVKFPKWNGKGWQTEVYDEDCQPLFLKSYNKSSLSDASIPSSPLEFIKPKSQMVCLVQSSGIAIVSGKVYITWGLKQAIVQNAESSDVVAGVCFLPPPTHAVLEKMKTDTSAEYGSEDPSAPPQAEAAYITSEIADDTDDDENSDEEAEVEAVVVAEAVVSEEDIVITEDVDMDKKSTKKRAAPKKPKK